MTPDRYARICDLFDEAERLPPEQRRPFLADRCGDDTDLLAEVEGMLAHAPDTASLLDTPCPVNVKAALPPPPGAMAGRRLGPYEVRRQIGSGGMGTVFLAVRVDDYEQQVAVKLLRAGLASDELIERFRTERQLLAGLNHPNIGRLLDGGTTSDGMPYFVMEYIDGEPLDRWCESRRLGTRDRAALLADVCDAVEYAHRRTVVHRDLKPGNVLVTTDGCVKVVDFGLAKRIDAGEGRTHTGVILGTPSYMAPEQAGGKGKDVGPAADVWALGAILYELLTGRPPFRADTPLDTVLQVVSDEPVPPSRLHPNLPHDLETICLKCLQKDPARRYGSAAEVSADLRRFLQGEPIRARPVGRAERAWRWCRRNPRVALLLTALAVTLVGGFAAVTALWLVAEDERDLAERRGAALAIKTAEAEKERDRAEKNFNRVFGAVQDSLTAVSNSKELKRPDMLPFRRKLLDAALKQFEDFVKELGENPRAEEQLARARLRVGQILRESGRSQEAVAQLEQGIELARRLVERSPRSEGNRRLLALGYEWLGVTHPDRAEGVRSFARCMEIREALLKEQPDQAAGHLSALAFDYYNAGHHLGSERPAEALAWLAKARAIREEQATGKPSAEMLDHLAQTCLLSGAIELRSGRTAEAEASCRRAIAVYERLCREYPAEGRHAMDLAKAHMELNLVFGVAHKRQESLAALNEAVAVLERLVDRESLPGTDLFPYQLTLAGAYYNLMLEYRGQLMLDEAAKAAVKSRGLCEKLLAVRPANTQLLEWRAGSCATLGMKAAGRPEEVLALYREACDSLELFVRLQPKHADNLRDLALARQNVTKALTSLGRRDEALAAQRQAIEAQRQAVAVRTNPAFQRELADRLQVLGDLLRELKRPAEAAEVSLERARLLGKDRRGLYRVAAELARCAALAAELPSERERYALAAVEQLRAAVAAGFSNAGELRDDEDFAALRGRGDFEALLRGLTKE